MIRQTSPKSAGANFNVFLQIGKLAPISFSYESDQGFAILHVALSDARQAKVAGEIKDIRALRLGVMK